MTESLKSLSWGKEGLTILDQTKLPETITYKLCTHYEEVADAIKVLAVRGAPAIGVAAAYAVVLAFREYSGNCQNTASAENFKSACEFIRQARPTAVNLSWAVDQLLEVYNHSVPEDRAQLLLEKAQAIEEEDIRTCRAIGTHGADLFQGRKNLRILTHCNTGALATAGIGTAFGVIQTLFERGQVDCVYADETRPLLQGSRLTASELMAGGIPCRLIADDMAASVMRDKKIDAIIVGADRIAANGDTANKIGTYGLAVMAAYHKIPFYIAAPFSTFDFTISTGKEIPIEERNPEEVRRIGSTYIAPKDVPVYNPAFDVTPATLIHGIITERGVLTPPYSISIASYERSL